VTAFGTKANHREWNQDTDTDTGVLIEVETGRVIIEGLCRPHSPLRTAADDGWIIANSGRGELVWVSDDGERSALEVGDWPNDVVRCGDHLIVDVCATRLGTHPDGTSGSGRPTRLVVVAESTRSVIGECILPIRSAYDLVLAPEAVVDGLRIGTATNPVRMMDQSVRAMLSAPATSFEDAEPAQHDGEVVIVDAPSTVVLGDDFTVSLRIVYRGEQRGRTFGDDAIRLGVKWRESGVETRRAFSATLVPHQVLDVDMVFECPPTRGRHTLELGLLQELVTWFGITAEIAIDVVDERPIVPAQPSVTDDVVGGLVGSTDRRARKLADVASVENWWHSIDLGDGVVTPGHKDPALIAQEWEDLDLPVLAGRSVLDIGAWDGYFSFTSERMGADRVVSVDDWVWAMRWDRVPEALDELHRSGRGRLGLRDVDELWDREGLPGKAGYDICHHHLSSRVQSIVANYMDLDPDEVGTFDVVLYLGVLYHEPNPLASLASVRALTRGVAVVETSALFVPGGEDLALAEFYSNDELGGDVTNWWSPNAKAARGMAEAAGFSRTRITKSYPPEWDALPAGSPPLLYRLMLHCYVD
jgi:tRNA (mo5U34)-methyltransferase